MEILTINEEVQVVIPLLSAKGETESSFVFRSDEEVTVAPYVDQRGI
jgi:hypothetical protein